MEQTPRLFRTDTSLIIDENSRINDLASRKHKYKLAKGYRESPNEFSITSPAFDLYVAEMKLKHKKGPKHLNFSTYSKVVRMIFAEIFKLMLSKHRSFKITGVGYMQLKIMYAGKIYDVYNLSKETIDSFIYKDNMKVAIVMLYAKNTSKLIKRFKFQLNKGIRTFFKDEYFEYSNSYTVGRVKIFKTIK